jgi:formylglycine-generating enzyme required for sulfatase activity
LGLATNSGAGFKFFGTYVSSLGYRSTEAMGGNDSGTQGWNPFNVTAVAGYTIKGSVVTITTNSYNRTNGQMSLTWQAAAGANYSALYSTNLSLPGGGFRPLASGLVARGNLTTATVTLPTGPAGFVKITLPNLPQPPAMALIPAGWFTMGDTLDGEGDATPASVYVSGFYMDVNLVTSNLWASVYNYAIGLQYGFDEAGAGKAANHPVQTVNWYDSVKWCNARSQQAGLTPLYYTDAGLTQIYTNGDVDSVYVNGSADGYRLPTEAEWEKAARGRASGERFPWGNTISESQANYDPGSGEPYDLGGAQLYGTGEYPWTSPVGSFPANGYGLNDMAGNVSEWCWDWYGTPYGQPTNTNPTGPTSPTGYRVLRGGSWESAVNTRSACRSVLNPNGANNFVGFRCVRGL